MSRLFRVKYCTLPCHGNYMLRPTELHARHSQYNYLLSLLFCSSFLELALVLAFFFFIHTFWKQLAHQNSSSSESFALVCTAEGWRLTEGERYWHPTGCLDRGSILLQGSPRSSSTDLSLSANLPTVYWGNVHLVQEVWGFPPYVWFQQLLKQHWDYKSGQNNIGGNYESQRGLTILVYH